MSLVVVLSWAPLSQQHSDSVSDKLNSFEEEQRVLCDTPVWKFSHVFSMLIMWSKEKSTKVKRPFHHATGLHTW